MQTIRAKVQNVNIGKYDVDSIVTTIEGKTIEICFEKKYEVLKYLGNDVILSVNDGKYSIEPHINEIKAKK